MSLRPLGDHVVVKVKEEEVTTASGIVLPGSAKEKPLQGTVVAVGPGALVDGAREPMDVAVGDEVIYSKYAGNEVKIGEEEYLVIKQSDILAVVE